MGKEFKLPEDFSEEFDKYYTNIGRMEVNTNVTKIKKTRKPKTEHEPKQTKMEIPATKDTTDKEIKKAQEEILKAQTNANLVEVKVVCIGNQVIGKQSYAALIEDKTGVKLVSVAKAIESKIEYRTISIVNPYCLTTENKVGVFTLDKESYKHITKTGVYKGTVDLQSKIVKLIGYIRADITIELDIIQKALAKRG